MTSAADDHHAVGGFTVGSIYEDCSFHPVLCTFASAIDDELAGISLIDGSYPRECSPAHCGPIPLSAVEAAWIRTHFSEYFAQRRAGKDPSEIVPSDVVRPF